LDLNDFFNLLLIDDETWSSTPKRQPQKRKIAAKENLANVDVEKILATMEGFKSSSSHERLFSLCEKYLHLFSGLVCHSTLIDYT
jgi:hypothetical protein